MPGLATSDQPACYIIGVEAPSLNVIQYINLYEVETSNHS
jgi:hypothetical protein